MSWFNEVTGTNDFERQSWRDSYNGGKAAGDWTGNTNARLEAERDAFQGATWSGSSSQPSALQLAQSMVGPHRGTVATGAAANTAGGVGNPTVQSVGDTVKSPAGGVGRGSLATGGGPLKAGIKDTATGGYAGLQVLPNPWFSDVEEWWEPRYGEPGEWLGGLVNIGVDIPYNGARAVGLNTDKLFADLANAPGRVWANARYDSDKISRNRDGSDWSPFWEVNASARSGVGGDVWKTGGGF